jgi:Yip1 domain
MRPFFSIWIKPKKTFEYLSKKDPDDIKINIDYLFAIISVSISIPSFAEILNLFEDFKIFVFALFILISAGLGVIIFKFINSFIILGISKLLQGKASIYEIRLIIAYSFIPYLIHLLIAFVLLIPAIMTENINLVFHQHPIVLFVVWIFAIRSMIYGLSYFNKFSYGFAVLNLIIPAAVIQVIYLIAKF